MATSEIYKCKWCPRTFKKANTRDNHEHIELCLPEHIRTFCRLCNMKLATNALYRNHLMSREHLSKIGNQNIDALNIIDNTKNKIHKVNECDPILAYCSGGNDSPPENLKLYYNDGTYQKINAGFANDIGLSKLTETKTETLIKQVEHANKPGQTYQQLMTAEREQVILTARQTKILAYLAKFQNCDPLDMVSKFKVILEKIELDDANFLGTHIRNAKGLALHAKQIYCSYLDEFVKILTGMVIKGESKYRNIDIFEFVAKLTK